MSDNVASILDDLIAMTERIVKHSGEIDDDFIQLLEDRNQRFSALQMVMTELSKDHQAGMRSAPERHRTSLQKLYDLHKQAEAQIEQYKRNLAEQMKKIAEGKQASSLYGEGITARSRAKRTPYQVTPEAVFFDKKK